MTTNRTVKQTNRRRAAAAGVPYTAARQTQEALFDTSDQEPWADEVACCGPETELVQAVQRAFEAGGVDGLICHIEQLQDAQVRLDSHWSYGTSHAVLASVKSACLPLLERLAWKINGTLTWHEPILSGNAHARLSVAVVVLERATYAAWKINEPH